MAGSAVSYGWTATSPRVEPYFDHKTVVSLDGSGRPLSRYGDRRWDLSSMGTDGGQTPHHLYFFDSKRASDLGQTNKPDIVTIIQEQQRALIWLHMDSGRQRALRTMLQASLTLTALARRAYRRGITLFELFCDLQALGEETAGMNVSYANTSKALLRTLWRHRTFLKIDIDVRLKQLAEVIKQHAKAEPEGRQTPLIPSRIYCAILADLLANLDQIARDLPWILDAYRKERAATLTAPHGQTRKQRQWYRDKQLQELNEAMLDRGWKRDRLQGPGSLHNFIAGKILTAQLKLLNVVIAFTGMRIAEALSLPLKGVLEEVEHRGSTHHVVNGYSHKLNGGRKQPASWVTSSEGHRAILLAQEIASTVLETHRDLGSTSEGNALLFCALTNPYKMQLVANTYRRMHNYVIPEVCPAIVQADIDELNAIQLERSWLGEGFEVGRPWPLTFHQYRRSLSVYAHRSGMVSLPALKGQLQHITDEMRSYYSDGFCRAVNLVFDKEHFSHEWNAAKAESSFLAYSLAVLFSDEDLVGEVGGRGATRMRQAVLSRSREETLNLFRDGKLAYRETVLGGCSAVDGCDHTPLEPIPWDCLEKDCANTVVFSKRLDLLIKSQETVVATLESSERSSVEHRLEADHLRVLLKARHRLAESV